MTTSRIDRIIEEVKALTPDEQRSLRDLVDLLLASSAPGTGEELEQRLLAKGIINRIPSRVRDVDFYANRKPVEAEGKPVSEIIIEERR
jgi:hypothetical protein